MKKNVILLISLMLSIVAIGQNERNNPNQDGSVAPKFIGSKTESLNDYLTKNLVYPKKTAKCFIEGTEIVQFTVTPSGDVTNFKVINSICPEIDKEVISVLENTSGRWIPGVNNGESTAMEKEVNIPFAFCNECNIVKNFTRKALMYYKAGVKNLMVKNKPEKALHFFDMGLKYRPNNNALLLIRGLCNYELGDKKSAEKDWNRVAFLGGTIPREFDYNLFCMKGFTEMQRILKE